MGKRTAPAVSADQWDQGEAVRHIGDLLQFFTAELCGVEEVVLTAMKNGVPVMRDGKPVLVEKRIFQPRWHIDRVPSECRYSVEQRLRIAGDSLTGFPDLQRAVGETAAWLFFPPLHRGLRASLDKLRESLKRVEAGVQIFDGIEFVGPHTEETWAELFGISTRGHRKRIADLEAHGERVRQKCGRSFLLRRDLRDRWKSEGDQLKRIAKRQRKPSPE